MHICIQRVYEIGAIIKTLILKIESNNLNYLTTTFVNLDLKIAFVHISKFPHNLGLYMGVGFYKFSKVADYKLFILKYTISCFSFGVHFIDTLHVCVCVLYAFYQVDNELKFYKGSS